MKKNLFSKVAFLMKKKGKRRKTVDREERVLPEAMIQHIQSFMTEKEAAGTTLLSKSWYDAWLTRPRLDFDQSHFRNPDKKTRKFKKFARKSMQRYLDLNLKIERFKLRTIYNTSSVWSNKLTRKAQKMGATDLTLEFLPVKDVLTTFLPREVLESETLVRLSVIGRKIHHGKVGWSMLKSLILHNVHMERDDMLSDIVSCCVLIEELSISECYNSSTNMLSLGGMNGCELRKLRRLFLEYVDVGTLSFIDFSNRFPCLNDLRIVRCRGYQCYGFGSDYGLQYSANGTPSIEYITKSPSEELKSCVFIKYCSRPHDRPWWLRFKEIFTLLSPSRISLSLDIENINLDEVIEAADGDEPIVLENVTIMPCHSMPMLGLLRIFRPRFITWWIYHDSWPNDDFLQFQDQDLFGEFSRK